MTPHERELISKVADELRTADRSAIDPEAEQLIRTEVAAQRNAAYLLTQRVIVQELALQQAQAKIDELQGRGGATGRGNFLPGAAGAGAIPGAQGQPWGHGHPEPAPQPAPAGGGGGGGVGNFLKTAAAAAAGTVAANLIYDGIRHYAAEHGGIGGMIPGGFGGGHPAPGYGPHPDEPFLPDPSGGGGGYTGPDLDVGNSGAGADFDLGGGDDSGGGADYGDDPGQTDDQDTGWGGDFGTDDSGGGGDYGGDSGGGGDW
jgi:hypothetical protein